MYRQAHSNVKPDLFSSKCDAHRSADFTLNSYTNKFNIFSMHTKLCPEWTISLVVHDIVAGRSNLEFSDSDVVKLGYSYELERYSIRYMLLWICWVTINMIIHYYYIGKLVGESFCRACES
jgi:hypothetical protein